MGLHAFVAQDTSSQITLLLMPEEAGMFCRILGKKSPCRDLDHVTRKP